MPYNTREVTRWTIGTILAAAIALLVILAISTMWLFGFGWFSNETANFRGNVDKRNQVEANGAYRIGAYDHFFDLCTSIQANEATIINLSAELNDKNNPPTASRRETLAASITANRNQRAASIAQYNNDSQKEYTAGQFRDSDLPYRLDLTTENTTCAL